MNEFEKMCEELYGNESGSMPHERGLGTQDHGGLADLFGGFNFGERRGVTFSENAAILAQLLKSTAFSQAVNRDFQSSVGVDMTLNAMKDLTDNAMEVTGLSISKLNEECDIMGLGHSNTLRVVAKLKEKYNIEWLEGYVRAISMRLMLGKATHTYKLLVTGINTHIMKGQIAVPVVKMLGIPIKDWALKGPAALHALSQSLPQADLLPDTFEMKETVEAFMEALTQESLCNALTDNYDELYSLYLYLADGDEDTANHNIKMLKKAYGIAEEPEKDLDLDPDVDLSELGVIGEKAPPPFFKFQTGI